MEIKRIDANATQITDARKRIFVYSDFIIPNDTELTILSVGFVAHAVEGTASKNAVLVINIGRKETANGEEKAIVETVAYVRSFLRIHRDFQGNIVKINGNLNEYVANNFKGKTLGDLETYLLKLVDKKVKAVVTSYKGVDKNGNVRDIDVQGWDLVGDFPA